MYGGHHEQRGYGRRFGRRGFPSRDVVPAPAGLQAHLEQELQNVRDRDRRLGPETPEQQPEV